MSRRIRVLISKLGLDGHDRGAKAVSLLLREAGFEVIYLGKFQTPERIVNAAIQEDVDIIGLSYLNGGHLVFTPEVIKLLKQNHRDEVPVIVGGVIPREDISALKGMGVKEVFVWGSTSEDIAKSIRSLVKI